MTTEAAQPPNGKRQLYKGEHENGELDFPFEFPLKKPLPISGETHSVLVLQEPDADLVIKHNLLYGMNSESAPAVIAALSGATEVVVKRMTGQDFIRLVALLSRFFGEAAR